MAWRVSPAQGRCATYPGATFSAESTGRTMVSTIVGYQTIANDMTRSLQQTANDPQVARETAYYQANIGKVQSVDDLLGNYRLLSYALKAYGLGDLDYAKAFVGKLLTEGTQNSNSFANQLNDQRYRDFANAFNFAQLGSGATQTQAAQGDTVDRYMRQTLEENSGSDGVRLALYFQRKASGITNAYQILGDPALLQVVQTALGLSPLTSAANIDAQANMLSSRIDFADFQDPQKVSTFIQRFSALWDVANPPTTPDTSLIPQIAVGQPTTIGISADTLAALQGLKLGNR